MEKTIMNRAQSWLSEDYDEATRAEVKALIENDEKELTERFYRTLEFGTGGLRGIMGAGTNRVNIYTIGMATQGLANYLKKEVQGEIKVAVAYDSRNNSELFARTTAEVFAANGFRVYLFESLRPTPELSYAIRLFGCQSGVVVTASHNPKEYNGYKAYWADGGQVIAPHDKNIIAEVNAIESMSQVQRDFSKGEIVMVGQDVDQKYIDMIKALSLSPEAVAEYNDLKIVYTPIHGTGVKLVPMALEAYGFKNVSVVEEQAVSDGNFPTVKSPNPEEPAALQMAVDLANEIGADLVMATDPDADRQAIAVRDFDGKIRLLNGNQCASLLTFYILHRWKEQGKFQGNEFVVKTVVTSELLIRIAESFGVKHYDVLTGFKFIADIIHRTQGSEQFLCGGEESYGFLVGDSVRDKDAVASLAMAAECAAWAKSHDKSLWGLLMEIYVQYGLFKESLLSITRGGQQGVEEIKTMMKNFRENPPASLAGSKIVEVRDYSVSKKWVNGVQEVIDLPKSDVLQFVSEDSTIVSVRPSGTEPKIKFYFGVRGMLDSVENYEAVNGELEAKIEVIKKELSLS